MRSRYSHSITPSLVNRAASASIASSSAATRSASCGVEGVRRHRRSVVRSEVLPEVGCTGELRHGDRATLGLDAGDAIAEQRTYVLLVAPQRRRLRAGRRRRAERLHGREQLTDEPLRRPAEQPHRPTGTDDADELVGALLVMRSEHHADAGEDRVERAVGERQRLGVGLAPVDLDTALRGRATPGVEELRGEVGGDDVRASLRSGDGDVARARCDIEDELAGVDVAGLDERGAEAPDEVVGQGRVVTGGPHRAVLRLECAVGLGAGDGGGGHVSFPSGWCTTRR